MTMKAILAGAAMMLVAGLPAAAEAANAITSATVNFRASPSGAKLGAIPHGTPVTVLGRSGNWCQTEWGGLIGWVHCRYVQTAIVQAPGPYYRYGGDPFVHGAPFIGFGFGLFDDDFRHKRHHRRFKHHRFGFGDGGGSGGGFGGGGGGSSGSTGYLVN